MSVALRIFFRYPHLARSTGAIFRWWEARRPLYNLAVGTAGLLTLTSLTFIFSLPPWPHRFPIVWAAIGVYAVLANLFYTLGPAVDAAIVRRWGLAASAVGPALFRYGLVFAVGLTLLPIPLALLLWGLRFLGAVLP